MGSLIFGFRIQSLLKKINQGNLEDMLISIARDDIKNKISIMQESVDNAKNSWTALTNNALSTALSTYNSTITGLNNNSQLKSLQDQLSKADGTDTKGIQGQIDTITNNINKQSQEAYMKYQNFQALYTQANQATNSIFEEAQKRQLTALNNEDLRLDKKQKRLEADLTAWNQEMDNTKKAQDDAIKKETPTFGIA